MRTIIITALVVIFGGTALAVFAPTAFMILLGALFGVLLMAVIIGLLTPLFAGYFVNKPVGMNKSGIHFFTLPEEGKAKIIVRGDTIVRMVMIYGGHRFARRGSREEAPFWQIVRTPAGEKDAHPLDDIHPLLQWWAQYVYKTTGAVFTGIYPFQTVHEYPIERTKIHRDEKEDDASEGTKDENARKKDNLRLEVIEDLSDHFRVRQFLYPFRVPAADTKDKVPLNILGVLKARVKNPFKAGYGTDRWDIQTVNLATNATTNYTRSHTFEESLVAQDPDQAKDLNNEIKKIKDDDRKYGIEIDGVDLIDLSPNLSDKEKTQLYAEVLAQSLGKATERDGLARANALRELNKAIDEGGENSVEVQRMEALVNAAKAAAGGTVILGSGLAGGSESQTLAAILAELRRQTANANPNQNAQTGTQGSNP